MKFLITVTLDAHSSQGSISGRGDSLQEAIADLSAHLDNEVKLRQGFVSSLLAARSEVEEEKA